MNLRDLFIHEKVSIKEVIKKLDETAKKILLVTENRKLKGIITDGDIRRWILKSGDFSVECSFIMNGDPIYLYEKDKGKAIDIMRKKMIEAVPILNMNDEVIDIVFWNDNFKNKLNHFESIKNPVIIMAGGKGTRLYPYTKILPKPLIPIGDIPIVERIINRFNGYGCKDFYLTVNYKKRMIKAYFDEIDREYSVGYVEEDKPLGTAGSLSLLKDKIKDTFFVSNCDILIEGNYSSMIKYHKENENKITLITSLKQYVIPYGIIELDNSGLVSGMQEKPEYDFLVNTGMYILEPDVLDDIPSDTFYHITELINDYIERGEKIGVYPVTDKSWLDMGQFKEMESMMERLGVK